jgi:hypothetical protein
MTKTPIHLNSKHPADSLHEASRINYGKLFRVDHNVRVKDLGLVDINCIQKLVAYFEESSIKLTDDLKFKDNTPPLQNGIVDGIQDPERVAEFPIAKPPKISIDDIRNQWHALKQSSSPIHSHDALDIPEAHHGEQAETMFEFEP